MHMLFVAKCAIIIYIKSVISLERVIKMKMYEIGDVVVFGAEGLCRIEEITEKKFEKEKIKYYVLRQLDRENSVNYVPVNNEKSVSKMREVLTENEIRQIISEDIPETSGWIENNRERQLAFKEIILYGDSRDLIRLVRDLHIRRKEQAARGKKLHAADERIFKDAENIVFEEIAYALKIPRENVMDFISETAAV